jgi:hypothetical protein
VQQQVQQVRQQQEQQQEQLQQEQQQELQELELLFCHKRPKKLPTKKRLIVIFSFYFLKRLANHLTVIETGYLHYLKLMHQPKIIDRNAQNTSDYPNLESINIQAEL